MEKIFKNPLYTGIATFITLVIVLAWIYDEKTNPAKNFYGLLTVKTKTV